MRTHIPLAIVAATTLLTPGVNAWGAAGHEIVATIAQIHLHPSVLPNMCRVLNYTSNDPDQPLCHLAPPSTWADKLRFKMRWSSGLHYIGAVGDHPSKKCLFPGEAGWEKDDINVLRGIRNVTGLLEDWDGGSGDVSFGTANEALKFLIHFLGDMHMPLHLTGRDRGGNSDKVLWGNRETNLHSLWDGLLIAKAVRLTPRNYSRPIPELSYIEHSLRDTIYDSYIRKIMWEGIHGKWKDELDSWLACPQPAQPDNSPLPEAMSNALVFGQHILNVWSRLTGLNVGRASAASLPEETDDGLLCPYRWAQPIHALNCEVVWPAALDEPPYTHSGVEAEGGRGGHHQPPPERPHYVQLDTPEYAGVIEKEWIVERLLAQGGIRLAGILNYLFAKDEGAGLRVHNMY